MLPGDGNPEVIRLGEEYGFQKVRKSMREGKYGTLAWECLTFVVCDSRMLPPQSNSLILSQLD